MIKISLQKKIKYCTMCKKDTRCDEVKKINKRGFTLIELLAVIVILAIVMVVTIPSVLNAMSGAKISQLNNASNAVATWLTKEYELVHLGDDFASQEDMTYTNFVSKMGTFPASYSDAAYVGKDLNSCGNSNSTYCHAESIAMLESAGISDPQENIDLANSYVWLENNRFSAKLTASENGSFYTNAENASSSFNSRLPDGYREVRYLEGNNSGYVPTNIYLTGTNTVRFKFETPEVTNSSYILFGSYTSGTGVSDNYSFYVGRSSTYPSYIRYGNKINSEWLPSANTKYDIVMSPTGLSINDYSASWALQNQTFTCSKLMYIGYLDGTTSKKVIGKMYEFIVDGVFYGVPAVRESDDKTGYYDLVTNTFFPTVGTLTAGY